MAEKRDYYEVLGVSKTATDAEIKKAFRQQAKKYHPDIHPGDKECEEKFKEAQEAYAVLSDPDKRRQYDQFGHAAFDGTGGGAGGFDFSGMDMGDIFGDIFGDFFGGGRSSGRRNGPLLRKLYLAAQRSLNSTIRRHALPVAATELSRAHLLRHVPSVMVQVRLSDRVSLCLV